MYIIGYLLNGFVAVASTILFIAQIVIIASVVISWVNADPRNQLVMIIRQLTEPVYRKIQSKVKTVYSNIDFTPFIALLIIIFLNAGVLPALKGIAASMMH